MNRYLKIYSRLTPQELRQLRYKERYKKANPLWDDSLIILCKIFQSHLVSEMRVLDAGCGHGNLVIDQHRQKIKEAIGVDISKAATVKNVCLDKVVIADLEKLPFKDNYFDVALALWVFEHLQNPAEVFRQIYRVLKKGGVLIFVTPNKTNYLILAKKMLTVFPNLTKRFFRGIYGREEEDVFGTYYRANTEKVLTDFAQMAGFDKFKLSYNGDPSYIALNDYLFYLGVFLDKLPRFTPFYFTKPHIIGEFVK
ncbi:MAG TPA: class I SAM-dependent methyltransferase [Candidatus Bathyarchaeia archaeon]|nr:class I SAM-dependent methyltransferase [Candidatus Bathyarchaeia archaeon]